MTYKVASDLAQRRSRQLWLADLQGPAWEELPPEEQRANLVRTVKAIDLQLEGFPKNSPDRKYLGRVKLELTTKINAIRAKARLGGKGLEKHFIDVARERLTPFLFNVFMSEAAKRTKAEARDVPLPLQP